MAGEQEIRGTKNLGLVQAIYAGINPPMNTKIIWYDDNVGVKIHKYYDVTISEWVPFGDNGQIIQDLTLKEDKVNKGVAGGYVPLNDVIKITSQYLDIVNDLVTGGSSSKC
jgi:hypothetical protein